MRIEIKESQTPSRPDSAISTILSFSFSLISDSDIEIKKSQTPNRLESLISTISGYNFSLISDSDT